MVYASGRDVTPSCLAERALASSEGRYRALVDGLPGTAVFLVDDGLRLEFAAGRAAARRRDRPRRADRRARRRDAPRAGRREARWTPARRPLLGEERSLDIVSAETGHALWLRTSPLRGTSRARSSARCSSCRTSARASSASARSARPRSASAAPSRTRRSGWPSSTSTALPRGQPGAVRDHRLRRRRARPARRSRRSPTPTTSPPTSRSCARSSTATLSSSVDEKRYLRPDGTTVWVARSVTLVRDADGEPLHFLDQIQDVTERRRFERELRHLADHDPLTGPVQPPPLRAGARPPCRRGRALRPARRAARARPRPLQVRQRRARPPRRRRADPRRRRAAARPPARQRHARAPRRRRVRRPAAQRRPPRGRARRRRARRARSARRRRSSPATAAVA